MLLKYYNNHTILNYIGTRFMEKSAIKEKEQNLLDLVRRFCAQKLNEEYLELCEKLIKKMARKRDVPFKSGKLEIWAAAVVHAIGSINFLFDKSFQPYIKFDELNDFFGTKNSTVSAKSRLIKDMFDLWYFTPEFSTKENSNNNPFNNMVMIDGLIAPISVLPEDLQILLKNERANGRDLEFTTDSN